MTTQNETPTSTIDEAAEAEAIALLQAYGATAEPYQHPLHLLHHLTTSISGEDNLQQGFEDLQLFIKALITFFLSPAGAKAFTKSGGDAEDLPLYLPALLDFFSNLAASAPGAAILEMEQYQFAGLTVSIEHHSQVMKYYGCRLQADNMLTAAAA